VTTSTAPTAPGAGLDRVFASLADPTRRAMLDRLTRGPASVSELAEPFPISLPAVLKHLRVLSGAGLVDRTKRGRTVQCRLDGAGLAQAHRWLTEREPMTIPPLVLERPIAAVPVPALPCPDHLPESVA
jgi:DNA-binding transcriptional ArsR family regulator